MKYAVFLSASLLSAPAFAHTALSEHGHPHEASALPGIDLFAGVLTLAVIAVVAVAVKSRAASGAKARK